MLDRDSPENVSSLPGMEPPAMRTLQPRVGELWTLAATPGGRPDEIGLLRRTGPATTTDEDPVLQVLLVETRPDFVLRGATRIGARRVALDPGVHVPLPIGIAFNAEATLVPACFVRRLGSIAPAALDLVQDCYRATCLEQALPASPGPEAELVVGARDPAVEGERWDHAAALERWSVGELARRGALGSPDDDADLCGDDPAPEVPDDDSPSEVDRRFEGRLRATSRSLQREALELSPDEAYALAGADPDDLTPSQRRLRAALLGLRVEGSRLEDALDAVDRRALRRDSVSLETVLSSRAREALARLADARAREEDYCLAAADGSEREPPAVTAEMKVYANDHVRVFMVLPAPGCTRLVFRAERAEGGKPLGMGFAIRRDDRDHEPHARTGEVYVELYPEEIERKTDIEVVALIRLHPTLGGSLEGEPVRIRLPRTEEPVD
jgi:hypothetical protein